MTDRDMDKIDELLKCMIDPIVTKSDITVTELKNLGEAIDILKDLETIKSMRNSNNGYSGNYNYMPMDEYPRNSYRPARYSMDHNKQDRITDTLQNMLYNSNSDMERDIIERLMVKLG